MYKIHIVKKVEEAYQHVEHARNILNDLLVALKE